MTTPRVPIPKDVIDALEGGNLIEAIKRLRKSGMGLAEAKSALEQYARTKSQRISDPHADAGRVLPDAVVQALQRGDKMGAIALLRERTGLGLAEARRRVEAARLDGVVAQPHAFETPTNQPPPLQPRAGGLAPGEVKQSNAGLWVVLLAITALAAYFYFGP
jgi:ribosomal protein L7/L12